MGDDLLTTIFFAPNWPRRTLPSFFESECTVGAPANETLAWGTFVLHGLVAMFVVLQIVLPLRHYAYAEDTNWTERNHHFSWHMKLRGKTSPVRFYAIDPSTGNWGIYDLRPHLKIHQVKRMGRDPFMIRDFACFIKQDFERHGVPDVIVRAFVLCSMNGRIPQMLINPDVDLSQENFAWGLDYAVGS